MRDLTLLHSGALWLAAAVPLTTPAAAAAAPVNTTLRTTDAASYVRRREEPRCRPLAPLSRVDGAGPLHGVALIPKKLAKETFFRQWFNLNIKSIYFTDKTT